MKRVYIFHQLGVIPGVSGEFAAGEKIVIDDENNSIIERGFIQEIQEADSSSTQSQEDEEQ